MTKKFGHGVLESVQMYVVAPLDSVTLRCLLLLWHWEQMVHWSAIDLKTNAPFLVTFPAIVIFCLISSHELLCRQTLIGFGLRGLLKCKKREREG